jgi:hypothetical protein
MEGYSCRIGPSLEFGGCRPCQRANRWDRCIRRCKLWSMNAQVCWMRQWRASPPTASGCLACFHSTEAALTHRRSSTLLGALSTEQSENIRFPIDSDQWRTWLNVHMNFFRHGVMLEDLSEEVRELAIDVLRATLSVRGFE